MRIVLIVLSCLALLGFGVVRGYQSYVYDRECGGYLKRAADASNPVIARESLTKALRYIDDHGLDHGYTSLIWNSPDEDVGFWRRNIAGALAELNALPATATQLEASNVLMRVREVLVDQGQSVSVTEPDGISIYPNNKLYAALLLIILLILCIAGGYELKDRL